MTAARLRRAQSHRSDPMGSRMAASLPGEAGRVMQVLRQAAPDAKSQATRRTRMPSIIKNMGPGPITIALNSGTHLRLSPGETSNPVRDVELKDNAKINKLLTLRTIAVEREAADKAAAEKPAAEMPE